MQKKNELELPQKCVCLSSEEMCKCEGGAKNPLAVLKEQLYKLMSR